MSGERRGRLAGRPHLALREVHVAAANKGTTPEFDLTQIDRLLTTTRAVPKRIDLQRPVEPEVIEEYIRIAIQAPTGGRYACSGGGWSSRSRRSSPAGGALSRPIRANGPCDTQKVR